MISDDRNAMRHLDEASSLSTSVAEDCQYWLAVSKQHLNMFDQAKRDFDDCQSSFSPKTKNRLSTAVELHITQCDNGLRLSKTNDIAVMQPVKGNINSNMPEIAPVFCNIDSSLYFGGKRTEGNSSNKRGKDYDPASDIFVAKASNGSFDDPQNGGKKLNKKKADYPTYMNLTGKLMYLVRKDKKIIYSRKSSPNAEWIKPSRKMRRATSLTTTADTSLVVFTVWKGINNRNEIYFCNRIGKKKYTF